jgi:hypothetical protein
METQELWWLGLGIGAVVVTVVAVLLGLIIAAARSIDDHAQDIWVAGKEIAGNTAAVWMLGKVAGMGTQIGRSSGALEEAAESIRAGGGLSPRSGP